MKAHELLADPKHWTQGAMARDSLGQVTHSNSDNAVCWCVMGALNKCYGESLEYINKIRERIGGSVALFNDSHTHIEVVNLLKELDV